MLRTDKKLISFQEHQSAAYARYIKERQKHSNGIACPRCGKELLDADEVIINRVPPTRQMFCQFCPFRGHRYA